ncbi:MAG: hypothetical protein IJX22_02335 [Opitutales bacterium]|nr:hypothetical protein [Opitutales bacterium]
MMKTVLITAGATREFFDPVRFISNPSSGKMGYAIAAAARERGANVILVSANVSLPVPEGVNLVPVTTGEEMLAAVRNAFPRCDVLIKTAAVCDFRPKHYEPHKRKKDGSGMVVEFEPVADILKTVAATKTPRQTVVGFAAETQNIETYARKKLVEKNLDLIAANLVGRGSVGAFGADDNTIFLLGNDGFRKVLGPAPKTEIGKLLIAEIEAFRAQKLLH